ncbi:glycosyltransferase family 2 protein [Micromonospora sp. CPCC 205711]|uniref:glycosyltransferase family 2 protein n=1 Tax=Micromonospora sp. CPCC 205547 TaxID=3122400 RepID=UPI002FEEAE8B
MAPRLSIVVPFYNVGDYIRDCLESLTRQTFRDFEVVLVDDGSKDHSADIAQEFCDRDPRFRIVTQDNQGLGPARNTGVRNSQGEYITFVDSDDLVAPHAYEVMVRSLDQSGSSLVGGNARRFNNTSGVRVAYLHRSIFTADRQATHILEYPNLALDRMVWNKVYRRSFWDEFKLEFPPIRYEDYPVTLKGHLDAVTVDCLAAPVYFWRERESGESITQQKFQYGNLADRIVSAEMVLDLLDKRAPELRPIVHRHFAEIDLATVVQAFATAEEHEREPLVALGQRLTHRLDPAVLEAASSYDRLQYRALEAGDADLLRRLAEFRADGGLAGGARARRHSVLPWRYENAYPAASGGSGVPRQLYRLPRQELKVHSTVTDLSWDDAALVVRGTAEIRHLPTSTNSTLRVALTYGGKRVDLPVQRFTARDSHTEQALVGFEVRVPRAALAAMPAGVTAAHLAVDFRSGLLRRRGTVSNPQPGNPQHATGGWVSDDVWIQPGGTSTGELALRKSVRPVELTGAVVSDDALTLSGRLPADLTGAYLQLSRSAGNLRVDLDTRPDGSRTAFTARIPLDDLHDSVNPDDPFTQRTARVPSIESDQGRRLLLATGLDAAVSTVHHGRLITVTRSPNQYVNVFEGPVQLRAEQVRIDAGDRLVVTGRRWDDGPLGDVVWRRYLDDSDDHVDVPCELRADTDGWSAAVDLVDLHVPPLADQPAHRMLADWTLFALPAAGGSPYALQADGFLIARLPLDAETGGRSTSLRPRSGRLHLEVR